MILPSMLATFITPGLVVGETAAVDVNQYSESEAAQAHIGHLHIDRAGVVQVDYYLESAGGVQKFVRQPYLVKLVGGFPVVSGVGLPFTVPAAGAPSWTCNLVAVGDELRPVMTTGTDQVALRCKVQATFYGAGA